MTNETKLRLKKTLSPARWELQSGTDRMRRHEGAEIQARAEKTQREAHKRSERLFNFHIRCDIYKLPQQSGGGRVDGGRRSGTPGAHMGFRLRCHVTTGGGGWLTKI